MDEIVKRIHEELIGKEHKMSFPASMEPASPDSKETSSEILISILSDQYVEHWWGFLRLEMTNEILQKYNQRALQGIAHLYNHETDDQIGILTNPIIKNGKLYFTTKYSQSAFAQEKKLDIESGILPWTSGGFMINEIVLEKEEKVGEMTLYYYKCTNWTIVEGSSVTIPRDISVGFNRSIAQKPEEKPNNVVVLNKGKENIMDPVITPAENPSPSPVVTLGEDKDRIELRRQSDIMSLARDFKELVSPVEAREFVDGKKSANEFNQLILQKMSANYNPDAIPATSIGMTEKEMKKYALAPALDKLIAGGNDISKLSGIEAEAHRALEKVYADQGMTMNGGLLIPFEVQHRKLITRSGTVGTPSAGGYLVGTKQDASSFVDLLTTDTALDKLGATSLFGLKGNVEVPKLTGDATAYWVGEDENATESALTFGQYNMTPKTVGGHVLFSRKLLQNSDPSIEALVFKSLSRVLNIALDKAGIQGLGSAGQPQGVVGTDGVGAPTVATITWLEVLKVLTLQGEANAMNFNNLKWLMPYAVKEVLQSRLKDTYGAQYLMMENGMMAGYESVASNQAPSATLIFGAWEALIRGFWGGLELLPDPYSNSQKGQWKITGFVTVDYAVSQPTAFQVGESFT